MKTYTAIVLLAIDSLYSKATDDFFSHTTSINRVKSARFAAANIGFAVLN
ncbi:MAG: hypothetical protein WA154_03030 [Moraxellaceae bacterium]